MRKGNESEDGCGGEGGGMELVELDVSELGPGAEGHGHTVAGGYRGVGGVEVELAGSAGGEDNGVGADCAGKSIGINDFQTGYCAVF